MEFWTIIGGIVAAVCASWGGVFLNNRYQFKAQKENHERQMKTEALTKAVKALSNQRLLLLRLPVLSPEKINDIVVQNVMPQEFFLWADNDTVRAVLDLGSAIAEEGLRLTALKIYVDEEKEESDVLHSVNQRTPRILSRCIEKAGEKNRAMRNFASECQNSCAQLEAMEARVVACIRREIGIAFNEAEYRKMSEAFNERGLKALEKHIAAVADADKRILARREKFVKTFPA